ncbi:MAG TPA: cyclic nucleotide-binding domain-containing protein [Anaerolineae bacterium]|nr:cyclic nucleotide-binding domain-containing protein [Anaerolineae bacterium]
MKISMIGSLPLFAALTEEEQQLLSDRMRLERHAEGELLFVQGEASRALHLIKSGWVRLSAEGFEALASMGPGSLVGETDMFAGRPRSTSAEATVDTETWVLSQHDLEEVISEQPSIGVQMSRSFGGKVVQLAAYLTQRLRAVPGFRDLDTESLQAMAIRLQPQKVRHGNLIFQIGDPGEALYIVESGLVRLLTEQEEAEIDYVELPDGAVFGEMPLLTGKLQGQTARAASDVLLWSLSKADFDDLSDSHPEIKIALSRELRGHLSPDDRSLALQRLQGMPLFDGLPEEALRAIAARLLLQHAPAGEQIFEVGGPGDTLYLVDSGQVELVSEGRLAADTLARLGAGGFFGEMALLTGKTRSASARALQDSNLWVLYRSDFDDLQVKHPAISRNLSRTLAQRLADADKH